MQKTPTMREIQGLPGQNKFKSNLNLHDLEKTAANNLQPNRNSFESLQ